MQIKTFPKAFPKTLKWLHWITTALVLMLVVSGQRFVMNFSVDVYVVNLMVHASVGTVVMALFLLRVYQRFIVKPVLPSEDLPQWQLLLAKVVQFALYGCLLLVPVSGYAVGSFHELSVNVFAFIDISQWGDYSDTVFTQIRNVHATSVKLMMGLIVLHASAAFYHHWVVRDNVMRSMTWGVKESTSEEKRVVSS